MKWVWFFKMLSTQKLPLWILWKAACNIIFWRFQIFKIRLTQSSRSEVMGKVGSRLEWRIGPSLQWLEGLEILDLRNSSDPDPSGHSLVPFLERTQHSTPDVEHSESGEIFRAKLWAPFCLGCLYHKEPACHQRWAVCLQVQSSATITGLCPFGCLPKEVSFSRASWIIESHLEETEPWMSVWLLFLFHIILYTPICLQL